MNWALWSMVYALWGNAQSLKYHSSGDHFLPATLLYSFAIHLLLREMPSSSGFYRWGNVYKKLFTLPIPCGHTATTFWGPTPLPVSLCFCLSFSLIQTNALNEPFKSCSEFMECQSFPTDVLQGRWVLKVTLWVSHKKNVSFKKLGIEKN